jgi:hypothetical protein
MLQSYLSLMCRFLSLKQMLPTTVVNLPTATPKLLTNILKLSTATPKLPHTAVIFSVAYTELRTHRRIQGIPPYSRSSQCRTASLDGFLVNNYCVILGNELTFYSNYYVI